MLSNVFSIIALGKYFVGNKGEKNCIGGKRITDKSACKKACKHLNIGFNNNDINGGICFKSGHTNTCKKNSNYGGNAFFICKKGKITVKRMC